MFKKNILPIFLLALVVVLSVFYIKQEPKDSDVNSSLDDFNTTELDSEFASKRLEVLKDRSKEIEELETMVSKGELTEVEIANVLDQINDIYYLKYQEVELEDAIVLLGYEECLVLIDDYSVNVSILTDTLTYQEFIEIANLVKDKTSQNYKVSIETVSDEN